MIEERNICGCSSLVISFNLFFVQIENGDILFYHGSIIVN